MELFVRGVGNLKKEPAGTSILWGRSHDLHPMIGPSHFGYESIESGLIMRAIGFTSCIGQLKLFIFTL